MLKNREELLEELKEKIVNEKNEIVAKELVLYYLLKDLEELQSK